MVEQLTLGIIVAAALADSINPCVFGVLIFLLAYMVTVFKNKLKMLIAGLIYTLVVYITYLLIGLGIAALLGFVVVLFEFPCTGAPYLAILALLSAGDYSSGVPLLLLYNLIFILPLFVIIGLVYFGSTAKTLEKWRKEHRGLMRLGIGLFLLALGAYLIYTALHF